MRLIHEMNDFRENGCVVALGTFDGVHLGHRKLIAEAVSLAGQLHVPSAALTFDRHPLSLIRPDAVPLPLTTPEEKERLLSRLGLDVLIVQPFTQEFSQLSPDAFFGQLYASLHPRALVVGFNYTFGRKGAGDSGLLHHLCEKHGVLCRIMEPVCVEGRPVSSSRIRALIQSGELQEAEALLGHEIARDVART